MWDCFAGFGSFDSVLFRQNFHLRIWKILKLPTDNVNTHTRGTEFCDYELYSDSAAHILMGCQLHHQRSHQPVGTIRFGDRSDEKDGDETDDACLPKLHECPLQVAVDHCFDSQYCVPTRHHRILTNYSVVDYATGTRARRCIRTCRPTAATTERTKQTKSSPGIAPPPSQQEQVQVIIVIGNTTIGNFINLVIIIIIFFFFFFFWSTDMESVWCQCLTG